MTRVGNYVLESLLGKGGMGEVWKARDETLGRTVAIKLLQRGNEEDLARFKREARVVARLSHPHIASLFEVGDDPPHIVMQFIAGTSIDLSTLPLRAKAAALAEAARAVHLAHTQGVIHRDLKPANIMIDDAGRGIVLDFGLARDVNPGATSLSLSGDIMGTPIYMSPEQARGDVSAVDARTDVYGLGATLYALLAGRGPHAAETTYEAVHSAIHDEPARPGGERDLETICLKAIEREPGRRYASAAAFADDLERFLRDEPIAARPASTWYRLTKRLQRQPVLWSLVGLLVAAILGGAGIGVHQFLRSQSNLARADEADRLKKREGERAQLVQAAAAKIREAEDLLPDVEVKLSAPQERLRAAIDLLSKGLKDFGDDAQMMFWMGRAHDLLWEKNEAERWYTRAIEKAPGEARARLYRAQVRIHSALRTLYGGISMSSGRSAALFAAAKEDLDHSEGAALNDRENDRLKCYQQLMTGHFSELRERCRARIKQGGRCETSYALLGLADLVQRDFAESVKNLDLSLRFDPRQPDAWFARGMANDALHHTLEALQDYTRAIELDGGFTDAYLNRSAVKGLSRDFEGALADASKAVELAPGNSFAYNNRGWAKGLAGDHRGEIEDFTKAIELDPRNAEAYFNRGVTKSILEDPAGAVEDFTRAIDIDKDYAPAYGTRGPQRAILGDTKGGLEDLTKAIDMNTQDATVFFNRASLRERLRDLHGAMQDFTRAIELQPDSEDALYGRTRVESNLKDYRSVIEDCTRWIGLNPKSAKAYVTRGWAKENMSDYQGAVEDCTKGIDLDPTYAKAFKHRGQVRESLREFQAAIDDYSKSIELDPRDGESYVGRGTARSRLGDHDGAIQDFTKGIELKPTSSEAFHNRGLVHYAFGRFPQALADFNRAVELKPELEPGLRGLIRSCRDQTGGGADY